MRTLGSFTIFVAILFLVTTCGSPPPLNPEPVPVENAALGFQVINQADRPVDLSLVAIGSDGSRHILVASLAAPPASGRIDPALGATPECLKEVWCSLGPGAWTLEVCEKATGRTQRIEVPAEEHPRWVIAVVAGGSMHVRTADMPMRLA